MEQKSKFLKTTLHNEQIPIRNGFIRLYLSPMLKKKKVYYILSERESYSVMSTLWDPMDYTVHEILQARILAWVAFSFSRDLPNPGTEPRSPALQADSLPACHKGSPKKETIRKPGFDLWVGKIPWRREWHPTPVFLPGEFHGQRSLMGYSPQGHRVRYDWASNTQGGEVAPFSGENQHEVQALLRKRGERMKLNHPIDDYVSHSAPGVHAWKRTSRHHI